MNTELFEKVMDIVEGKVRSTPSPTEFEMAYQARVAIDRIRLAIKLTEQSRDSPHRLNEAGFYLLDALDRLESAERNFQKRFRAPGTGVRESSVPPLNGKTPGAGL